MPLNHSLQSMVDDGTVKQTLFVGTVVNNVDPLGINRVQVTIEGRLAAGSSDLPWMAPMRVSPFGQGAGFGVYGAPQIGSQVLIEAQEGHLDHAFYVAGYYGVSNANAAFASPDVWGFQDPSGTYLIVNLKTKVWTFHHASGLIYSYDAQGNYVMQTPGFVSIKSSSVIDLDAPTVNTTNALMAGNGASGTIVDVNGKVVTFQAGICTDIS